MLNDSEIKRLIRQKKLIEGFLDLDVQLTPNGFDLTAGEIFEFAGRGIVDFSNSARVLPSSKLKKSWKLGKGAYKVKTNEVVNLPKNLAGLAFPRSSLLRMGAYTQTGVWDAGFSGKSEFLLVVDNPRGIELKRNARIAQIIFFKVNRVARGYSGLYKGLK